MRQSLQVLHRPKQRDRMRNPSSQYFNIGKIVYGITDAIKFSEKLKKQFLILYWIQLTLLII